MKKRILLTLLVMALLVSAAVFTTQAVGEETCPHCGVKMSEIEWKNFKAADFKATNGHYVLTADVSRTQVFKTDGNATDVVLDLKGYNFSCSARTFQITAGKTISIIDTDGKGSVTGAAPGNGGVYWINGGTLKLYGGNNYASKKVNGSVAYVDADGSLLIGGNAVVDGKTFTTSPIYVAAGTAHIEGGTVKGANVSDRGGSIYVASGDLTVSGGTISGGQAANKGAEIYVASNSGTVSFQGGTVEGEIMVDSGNTLTASGNAKLYNLIIGSTKLNLGALTDGADIAVRPATASEPFTVANENAKTYLEKGYIRAYALHKAVVCNEDNTLSVTDYICPCCNTVPTWTAFDGTVETGKHYYLTEDYNNGISVGTTSDTTVEITLDLAGKDITVSAARAFMVRGTLNLLDTQGGGTVTSGDTTYNGSVFSVQATGKLNVYGGTYVTTAAPTKGSVIYAIGDVNIYGGTFDGSAAQDETKTCSTVYLNGEDANVVIHNGAILGANAKSGGSIYVEKGNLTVSGGTIFGGQAVNYGDEIYAPYASSEILFAGGQIAGEVQIGAVKTLTVSGKPVLADLKIGSTKITLGTLEAGASVAVRAEGAFTVANENAKAYLEAGYIKSAKAGTEVVEQDGVLYVQAIGAVTCPHCGEKPAWKEFTGTITSGEHYYLTNEYTSNIRVNADVSVVLDLRGNNIAVANNRAFFVQGTLNLVDTVGTGVITSGHGTSDYSGGVFSVQAGGAVYMYGGTARCVATTSTAKGSVVYVVSGGAFYMKGGTLDGNGQVLETVHTKGDFYLEDGQILGTASRLCGSIYVTDTGNFRMSGGTVSGGSSTGNTGVYAGGGDNIYVDGGKMTMTGGTVTVSDTAHKGNAVMVRNNGQLTLQALPQQTNAAVSGYIYLDNTSVLQANCGAASYDSVGRQTWYSTNAQAMAGYETMLKLYTDDALELTKDARVDVNGHRVAVSGDFTLTGMDSSATEKAAGTGAALFSGAVSPSLTYGGSRHIALVDGETVTFHVMTLRISKVSLRPGTVGIYYTTRIACDPTLEKAVVKYGVAVSLYQMPGVDFADPETQSLYTQFTANGDFVSGEFTGALVNWIMKNGLSSNATRAQMPIYANAYVILKDGTVLAGIKETDTATHTLKEVVTAVNRIHPALTEYQQGLLQTMYKTYQSVMADWDLHNFQAHLEGNYQVKKLKVLTLGHSLAVDANHMLAAVAAAEGATDITVGTLYYSGCTLTQHVNFLTNEMNVYDLYFSNLVSAGNAPAVTNNVTMDYALQAADWDIVVLQAGVFEAGLPNGFDGAAKFDDNLQTIMDYVKSYCPQAKFMWNMTWACPEDTSLLNATYTSTFDKYFGKSQLDMYAAISNVAENRVMVKDAFQGVIPSATAIQNANITLTDKDLYRDTIHANDYGRLIAAYTWYSQLTGRTLTDIALDTIPASLRLNASADLVLTQAQEDLLIQCVNAAVENPYDLMEQ